MNWASPRYWPIKTNNAQFKRTFFIVCYGKILPVRQLVYPRIAFADFMSPPFSECSDGSKLQRKLQGMQKEIAGCVRKARENDYTGWITFSTLSDLEEKKN